MSMVMRSGEFDAGSGRTVAGLGVVVEIVVEVVMWEVAEVVEVVEVEMSIKVLSHLSEI